MAKTISDIVDFDTGTPEELYHLFMDSEKISEVTGFDTKITEKEGEEFSAMNGGIIGRNLYILPNRMIVQSWRRITWKKEWLDAIVVIAFTPRDKGTRVDLINANLPEPEVQFIDWNTYWNPIKAHLLKKAEAAVA